VQEVENIVFKERQACVANIKFIGDLQNIEQALEEIRKNENVLDITI
jgi:hypothetical protein